MENYENTEKKKIKRKNDSKSLEDRKAELLKELNEKILKKKQFERKKAEKEFTADINFALSGLKLNELKSYGKTFLLYGIFDLYKSLNKEEKKKLEERSKELQEQFAEHRRKPFLEKRKEKNKTQV